MKLPKTMAQFSSLLTLLFFLASCSPQTVETDSKAPDVPAQPKVEKEAQLPVQYQRPSYKVDMDNANDMDTEVDDISIKVGASIRSTQGPQPLWDILKRLAALKKMNVSWASDVDQNVLVDVDINANDDFYGAIENLLRQVDFYHEMEGSTIVVKYKETRQFHIAMPFTKQLYETATGGNVLGSNEASSNVEGTIRLESKGNEFDIWKNIEDNMNAILDIWSTSTTTDLPEKEVADKDNAEETKNVTRQVSAAGNRYTIDKPVGLVTVHAPRPLLDKLETYFDNLKKELYKQVSIEAKIIEVQLSDSSSIGLNWNMLLQNLSAGASAFVNKNRSENILNDTNTENTWDRTNDWASAYDPATGISGLTAVNNAGGSLANTGITAATVIANGLSNSIGGVISMATFSFDSFLNAVKDQGETTILSNPKLSVLNGQPALITVGRNVTYIDSIESDVNADTGTVSYTVNTERILSGVGLSLTANILENEEIVMNLVPVTSELQEEIEYRTIGAGEIGLPIINVREMSTTVRVKDGEMLVIGGLISTIDQSEGTFIPGLGSIPLVRYLFGYEEKVKRKRELIILLKPRII